MHCCLDACQIFKSKMIYLYIFLINTLRPRQDGRHFPDDIFKCIFLNENAKISIKTSLKFVPKGPINIIPALVQIMAWRRPGDKPLSEPMIVSSLTHICVTRPQWVNTASKCPEIWRRYCKYQVSQESCMWPSTETFLFWFL